MDVREFTTVLLAGGKSRRMGRDKLSLIVAGKPLFERVLDALRPLAAKVLVITNDEHRFSHYAVTTHADIYPGSALGGLYTGLYYAPTEYVFVSACDLPYANLAVAQYLCAVMGDHDVSVVSTSHGFEPLFACYSKRCLPAMELALCSKNYKIQRIWSELQVKVVSVNEIDHLDGCASAFINVNSREDLDKIVLHPC